MSADTANATPLHRVSPLHRRLLLPLLLLLALMAVQAQREQAQVRDQAVLDLIEQQATLARQARRQAMLAAQGDEQAGRALDTTLDTARTRLEGASARFPRAASTALLATLRDAWQGVATAATGLATLRERRARVTGDRHEVDRLGAELLLRGDELLAVMEADDEPADRMRAAGRQLVLAQRMAEAARQALRGEQDVLVMADRLGRDAVLFGAVNNALLNGDPRLRLARVKSDPAHDVLRSIGDLYRELATLIEGVLEDAVALSESRADSDGATHATARLLGTLERARASQLMLAASHPAALLLRDALAALTVVSLLGAMLFLLREHRALGRELLARLAAARRAGDEQAAMESRLQRLERAREASTRALGSTLAAVREGNLGARCELDVSEWRELGAETLAPERELVMTLNRTLDTLAERLAEARRTSREVARAIVAARDGMAQAHDLTGEQSELIAEVRPLIHGTASGLETQAADAGRIGRDAREHAAQGRDAANMGSEAHARGCAAEDQLNAALRLASHLGERGRELRELVRLLDDLADEGRILALNAAIHASVTHPPGQAGDALSQAVQRLADGIAGMERRAGALADVLERTGEECVDGLRRAASGVSGSLRLAAVASERSGDAATGSERLAEVASAHAADAAALATGAAQRQSALQRVEQLSAVLHQAAAEGDQQVRRAAELVELLSAHLAALRLPSHDDANVVDLREFLRRS